MWGEATGVHLVSSLAWAEVCAVIARMRKEQIVTENGARFEEYFSGGKCSSAYCIHTGLLIPNIFS